VTPNNYQYFQASSDMAGPVQAFADLATATLAHPRRGMTRNLVRAQPDRDRALRYPGALRRIYPGLCSLLLL
jgi:hypothetical protein